MSSHTYLISGGLGFLGQYIVKAIRDYDQLAEIRILDCRTRPTLLRVESMPGVKLIIGDLRIPESFISSLAGVDSIIHCAAMINPKSGDDDLLMQTNIDGTCNLLQAALANGCRDFIFISSISAIGRIPGQISDETMVPHLAEKRSSDIYGCSKRLGEIALHAQASRIRAISLNPSVILGPGSPLINKVLTILHWLPCCPMLTNCNSFVDVRDVAQAAVLALRRGTSGERYIVASENIDNLSFMRMLMPIMGKKAPVFPIPDHWLRVLDWLVNLLDQLHLNPGLKTASSYNVDKMYSSTKIRKALGWRPSYTLEQTMRDTVHVYQGQVGYEPTRPYRPA